MRVNRLLFAALLATAIGGLNQARQVPSKAVQFRVEGKSPSLDGATEWLKSPPLKAPNSMSN